ncbi:675_t:CDS:2, partial [Racocetra persica]
MTLEDLESQLADLKRINRDLDGRSKEVDSLIQQESIKLDVETNSLLVMLSEVLSERDTHEGIGSLNPNYIEFVMPLIDSSGKSLLSCVQTGTAKNFIFQCTNGIQDIVNIDQAFTHELQNFRENILPQMEFLIRKLYMMKLNA